ncbi:MAG: addiction module protein [Gallionella sp.]
MRYNLRIQFVEDLMMNTTLLRQASLLDIEEQIELVEAIWNGMVSRQAVPPLTQSQKTELDHRLADHLDNPENVQSWHEVKAAMLANIEQ